MTALARIDAAIAALEGQLAVLRAERRRVRAALRYQARKAKPGWYEGLRARQEARRAERRAEA